jgi:serine/threonine-protein kinase
MNPKKTRSGSERPAPPDAPRVLAGLGYRAIARLGTGGMGEVYEAYGARQRELVVVKVLHRDLVHNPEMVDRMRVEAEVLRALSHPNIVAVSDFGTSPGGRPYLVMERLYGKTLHQELSQRGAFPLFEAVDCASQLLAALSAVHEEGFVHRDVKPSNLILCHPVGGRRRVKLIDFGVAKITGPGTGECRPEPLEYPTVIGACIGTPRFASPEQAWGQPVDLRADIYSAGLVLYALLTGRGPFDHVKGPSRLLEAHRSLEPDPPSKYAPLPPGLDQIVLKAIAKEPADRFADAASFRRELTDLVGRLCIPVRQILDDKSGERWHPAVPVDVPDATTVLVTQAACPAAHAKRAGRSGVRPGPRARRANAPIEPVQVFLSAVAFAAVASTLMLSFAR